MPSIIIMGGSISGLVSGLMLARAGHQVTVMDRDAAPMPQDVEEAAGWIRPTVPQAQHAHTFMALARSVLARRLPDVLGELLARGAGEYHLRQWMPPTAVGAEAIATDRTDGGRGGRRGVGPLSSGDAGARPAADRVRRPCPGRADHRAGSAATTRASASRRLTRRHRRWS